MALTSEYFGNRITGDLFFVAEGPINDGTERESVMAEIAAFMNRLEMPPLKEGMAKTNGTPIMATPAAVAIPAGAKIAASAVAFTIPVGAYVTGRIFG